MATPTLKLRKDIWTHFPVNVDPMGRGANGKDRHCIEWHNMKVRQIAKDQRLTEMQVKTHILPKLLHALSKSKAWTVEAPEPGSSRCIAVIAMNFQGPASPNKNKTRKQSRLSSSRKSLRLSSSRKSSRKSLRKTPNKTSPNKNKTLKVAKNYSALEGEAMYRKARSILNIMSESSVDRLSKEFASLKPKTLQDAEMLFKIITDIAIDQQAYHPLIMHLLHILDRVHQERPYPEKPSKAVGDRVLARILEEPVFAKMEAEETEDEDAVQLQKRFFRSVTLFTGFLYREGLLPWTSYNQALRHFAAFALEADPAELDYRVYDAYVQGLIFLLVRGGMRMVAEEGSEAASTFKSLVNGLERVAAEAKRGFIRTQASEFLKSAQEGFKIYAGLPWSVGAPTTDIKIRGTSPKIPRPLAPTVAPRAPTVAPIAPAAGLGSDIGELWRRFPLDVKQEGNIYVVRFHNKKLRERFQKESGKYRSEADLQAVLSKHILQLVDSSAYWQRGPMRPDAFLTIVAR